MGNQSTIVWWALLLLLSGVSSASGQELQIDRFEKQAGRLDNFGLWYDLDAVVKPGSVTCVEKLYISEPWRSPENLFLPPSILLEDMFETMVTKMGLPPFVCTSGEMGPMVFMPQSTSLYFGSAKRDCSIELSQIAMVFQKEESVFNLRIDFYEGS